MQYDEREQELINHVDSEMLEADPVYQRFSFVAFLSKSKGRGRDRPQIVEVELVQDEFATPGKWQTVDKLKLDELATEVYQADTDPNHYEGIDEKLRQEIYTKARRK